MTTRANPATAARLALDGAGWCLAAVLTTGLVRFALSPMDGAAAAPPAPAPPPAPDLRAVQVVAHRFILVQLTMPDGRPCMMLLGLHLSPPAGAVPYIPTSTGEPAAGRRRRPPDRRIY